MAKQDFTAVARAAARLCAATVGWPPAIFWASTPEEFVMAVRGHMGLHNDSEIAGMSASDLASLMERLPDER